MYYFAEIYSVLRILYFDVRHELMHFPSKLLVFISQSVISQLKTVNITRLQNFEEYFGIVEAIF